MLRLAFAVVLVSIGVSAPAPAAGSTESGAESLPPTASLRPGERLAVVASTSLIADVVAAVGGGVIDLTVLIGRSQDPHGYEPTPRALAAVERAHVVFVNGFDLEESLLQAIRDTARGVVIAVSDGIEPLEISGHRADPHVWTDPANVAVWAQNVRDALSAADPRNTATYRAGAAAYREQLRQLDEWIRDRVAGLPMERRRLVTDHDVLGYFAKRYGLEVIGVVMPGASTSAEDSARRTAELVELLRREKATAIFVGATAGRGLESLARSVASELGGEVRLVPLLTGSLDAKGRPGDTYLGYMRYNVDQIVGGLAH